MPDNYQAFERHNLPATAISQTIRATNETFVQFMTGLDPAALAVAAGFNADRANMVRYARPRDAGQHLYGETFFCNILMAIR